MIRQVELGIFAKARQVIINSLPKDLSERELRNKSTNALTANRCPAIFSKMRNKK